MLVLSRKPGERIAIGKNIAVVVNRISGGRVTIGVEAPKEVRVVRGELRQSEPPDDGDDLDDLYRDHGNPVGRQYP